MLNAENEITIGHKRKKEFCAMLDNYTRSRKSGQGWQLHDIQVLSGLISYYKMVERDYITFVIQRCGNKHNTDIVTNIKADLTV
jgi:hypothetical protein